MKYMRRLAAATNERYDESHHGRGRLWLSFKSKPTGTNRSIHYPHTILWFN